MNKILNFSLLLLTFILIPLYFVSSNNLEAAGVMIGASIVFHFFLNIDKFSSFKGGGIEATLIKKVNEAQVTIKDIQNVSKKLIVSTITNIMEMGRLGHDFLAKIQQKDNLINLAKDMNIDNDPLIQETDRKFHDMFCKDMLTELSQKLSKIIDNKEGSYYTGIKSHGNGDRYSTPDDLNELLSDHINNQEVKDLLHDYKEFYNTGKISRPNVWKTR